MALALCGCESRETREKRERQEAEARQTVEDTLIRVEGKTLKKFVRRDSKSVDLYFDNNDVVTVYSHARHSAGSSLRYYVRKAD